MLNEIEFHGTSVLMVQGPGDLMAKGSVCLTYIDNGTPEGGLFMFMLMVRNECRRQGIGRKLVEMAIAEAANRDLYLQPGAWLDRPMSDGELRAWYARLGFVQTDGDNLMVHGGNTEPHRIQLKRSRGWRKPEGVVSCGRPTKWGNDWRAGDPHPETRVRR